MTFNPRERHELRIKLLDWGSCLVQDYVEDFEGKRYEPLTQDQREGVKEAIQVIDAAIRILEGWEK